MRLLNLSFWRPRQEIIARQPLSSRFIERLTCLDPLVQIVFILVQVARAICVPCEGTPFPLLNDEVNGRRRHQHQSLISKPPRLILFIIPVVNWGLGRTVADRARPPRLPTTSKRFTSPSTARLVVRTWRVRRCKDPNTQSLVGDITQPFYTHYGGRDRSAAAFILGHWDL